MNILAFGFPGGVELAVIAVVGLLVFGRRLPSVARSVGSSIVEFKKGLKGVTSEVDDIKSEMKQLKGDIDEQV